jgi:hypothetical protein
MRIAAKGEKCRKDVGIVNVRSKTVKNGRLNEIRSAFVRSCRLMGWAPESARHSSRLQYLGG